MHRRRGHSSVVLRGDEHEDSESDSEGDEPGVMMTHELDMDSLSISRSWISMVCWLDLLGLVCDSVRVENCRESWICQDYGEAAVFGGRERASL